MFPRIPLPLLPFGLPTYGLLVAIGFVAALLLAGRLARRHGMDPHLVQDVAVWACLAGLVGAKVALIIVEPTMLRDAWQTLFQGGVFYGGFATALGTALVLCRRRGIDIHALGDLFAAPLALGHAFGRIGCFLAGCCFGTTCEMPWAMHYTRPDSIPYESGIPPSMGLHPVQLYEALGNFALAGGALLLLSRRRFAGQVIWSYVATYGAFRFIVESWRGDLRGSLGILSTSQAIGLVAVGVGLGMLAWRAWSARRAAAAAPAGADATATPSSPS